MLKEKSYTTSDLSFSMLITVRMNKVGLIYDISCNLNKDKNFVTVVRDFDSYSTVGDIVGPGAGDFIDALEKVKKEASEKYKKLVVSKNVENECGEEIVLDRRRSNDESREDGEKEEGKCMTDLESSSKTVEVKLKASCKKEEFLDFFFNVDFYKRYAPKSTRKVIKVTDTVTFNNLNREEMTFSAVMPDLLPSSRVKLNIEEVSSGVKVVLKQDGVLDESVDRVWKFWKEFLFPKFLMHFNCAVF